MIAVIGLGISWPLMRRYPSWRLVVQTILFAALTAYLLIQGTVPFEPDPAGASGMERLFLGVAKTIWWLGTAWCLIGFVRVFVIFERRPREGRLIQDLVVAAIYICSALAIIANVFNAPVGTLIATSGVLAVILGLALQSTLSDVFSGIALNINRPYHIGDWIVLRDGIEGRVVETNWRSTHFLDDQNSLVIVPNSDLAKARLTNRSAPEQSVGANIVVRLQPTTSPAILAEVMQGALLSSNTILTDPHPVVRIKSLDATAVELELAYMVAKLSQTSAARNELFDLVYRHTLAAGLKFAKPAEVELTAYPQNGNALPTSLLLLNALPLFATLTAEEREALSIEMQRRAFRKGELMLRQGEIAHALMIVRRGVVVVSRRDGDAEQELARLAPGDCVGEAGLLTGAGETAEIRALTPVIVYEISKEALASVMTERPALAEELAGVLAKRAELEKLVSARSGPVANPVALSTLAAVIRHAFNI